MCHYPNYPKDAEIEINTLEKPCSRIEKSDISFIINGEQVIPVEHQPLLNENGLLRIFAYIARIYGRIVEL